MPGKKTLKLKRPSQIEVMKSTPSELAREALLRSGAGAHDDHKKRGRQKDRLEEIEARLEGGAVD